MRERIRFGVALGHLNPAFHLDATREAERLGFESVGIGAGWLASEWQAAGLDFSARGADGSTRPSTSVKAL